MAKTREEAAPRRSGRATTATSTTNAGVQKPAPSGRPRGRPRKNPPKVPSGRPRGRPKGSVKKVEDKETPVKTGTGKRGRPKGSVKKAEDNKTITPVKSGTGKRGRPRKILGGEAAKVAKAATAPKASSAAPGVKKGRGRPRKVVVDATGAAEVETVEEAKEAVDEQDVEEMEGVEDGGADETDDAGNVLVKGDVDSADIGGDAQGEDEDKDEDADADEDDEADDSASGVAAPSGKETGQWMTKI